MGCLILELEIYGLSNFWLGLGKYVTGIRFE